MPRGVNMYPFVAIPEDDGSGWTIQFPDLPGATGFARSMEDVGREAKLISEFWLEDLEEDGLDIPVPSTDWDPINRQPEDFRIPKVYTTQEVAELLDISTRRVNALASSRGVGQLLGRAKVFTRDEIQKLKHRQPGRPKLTT
jgi:predicted RNase H-like HicB family nuclease